MNRSERIKNHGAKKMLITGLGGILLLTVVGLAQAQEGVEYGVRLAVDGQNYELVMKPVTTPRPDMTLTAQFTLKVPHATGVQRFEMVVEDHNGWTEVSRIDAPKESPEFDYISMAYNNPNAAANAFTWQANEEQIVLRFANSGACLGAVSLMPNDDVFNQLPNSVHTNPGNQFTNLGWGNVGTNHFVGIYGEAADCTKVETTSQS